MKKYIRLGRIASSHDITKVIIFLCSTRNKCITGKIIKVDEGRNLTQVVMFIILVIKIWILD